MAVYKGNINKVSIDKLNITNKGIEVLTKNEVLIKDTYFYTNRLGVLISALYDTNLLDYEEAVDYVKYNSSKYPENKDISCIYADEKSFKKEKLDKKQEKEFVKTLKKLYKEYNN